MKIPEKILNSTESASLEFTPFCADRSSLLCMPLRKSRDYSVVIYIHVSEAFLNIRSNAREKFGSTTHDLKFNRVIFTAPVYKAGVITGRSLVTLSIKRLRNYTWNKSFFIQQRILLSNLSVTLIIKFCLQSGNFTILIQIQYERLTI